MKMNRKANKILYVFLILILYLLTTLYYVKNLEMPTEYDSIIMIIETNLKTE